MSLHDAVAKYVQSGDTICFGGFTTNRKASKYQDAEDAKAQLAKAAAKAKKAADAKPDDAKLADAAARAAKAAADAESGAAVPETFKDYMDKWVFSVPDQDALLNKIGGARLAGLRVVPGLGYAGKI